MKVHVSTRLIPFEWISAHGLDPVLLEPETAHDGAVCGGCHQGICPYAAAALAAVRQQSGDLFILATLCDQERRMAEAAALQEDDAAKRVFLIHFPRSRLDPDAAITIFADELERLSRFLRRHGAQTPDCRCPAEKPPKKELPSPPTRELLQGKRPRLAICAGHLTKSDAALRDLIVVCGGNPVIETCEQTRCDTGPATGHVESGFDVRRFAKRHLDFMADVRLHPPALFRNRFLREIKERAVDGVVVVRYLWCDVWAAEVHALRQLTGLPVLELVSGNGRLTEGGALAQTRTRIEAFIESLDPAQQ